MQCTWRWLAQLLLAVATMANQDQQDRVHKCGDYDHSCLSITPAQVWEISTSRLAARLGYCVIVGITMGALMEFNYIIRFFAKKCYRSMRGLEPSKDILENTHRVTGETMTGGLQTHLMVILGTALFTTASTQGFDAGVPYSVGRSVVGDMTRVTAGVVRGGNHCCLSIPRS